MSNFEGNPIFRNQPPYTYYNRSFNHSDDSLYLCLNEIDPYFLQDEQVRDNSGFCNQVILDPRTQQPPIEIEFDHTCPQSVKIFQSDIKSSLTEAQHVVCLRVLKAMQQCTEIDEGDMLTWRKTERSRLKEQQQMQKFIYEYAQSEKEHIYAPAKRLVELYQRWYVCKMQQLLTHIPDIALNTHTGLPHVRVCKSSTMESAEITQCELLARNGWVPLLRNDKQLNLHQLHMNLEYYVNRVNKATITHSSLDKIEKYANTASDNQFYIPLESLLFLLTAGDYPDLPTELMLEIQSGAVEDDDCKWVNFEMPFPARYCGWHTHQQIVDEAFSAYMSTPGNDMQMLQLQNANVYLEEENVSPEIDAMPKQQIPFPPLKFEEYLQQHATFTAAMTSEKSKNNEALFKWRLKDSNSDTGLNIFTTMQLPPALDASATTFLGCHYLKLEYKPQFGCELMTKYELLKTWLQMRLMSNATAATTGKCLRLAVNNFAILLEEQITLQQLEQQLAAVYHIQMPQLLSNLLEFMQLLLKMPPGKYMLRFNAKYKDKLLLCAPTQEFTQNTVHLHELLKADPTDLVFMTQTHFLPISHELCSVVHLQEEVLPCTFLPNTSHNTKTTNADGSVKKAKSAAKFRVFNDRDSIIKRVQTKTNMQLAKAKKKRICIKKTQKARRRKLLKQKKGKQEQERKEEVEFQEKLEKERLFFGF